MSISCVSDIDCSNYEICKDLTCTHKDLFPDVLPIEIGAFFLIFIFSIITTVAGIGGGVIFLPILMIMFNFTPQEAAPISITMVFLILLLRNLLSLRQRHPIRDKPIINYEIALVFSPSNIIGNIFGAIINVVSATWLILIFLIIIMVVNAFVTGKKAIELRKATSQQKKTKTNLTKESEQYLQKMQLFIENQNQNTENNNGSPKNNNGEIELAIKKDDNDKEDKNEKQLKLIEVRNDSFMFYRLPLEEAGILNVEKVKETSGNLKKILQKESRFMDYEKVFLLFLNLGVLVLFNLFRGNKNLNSIVGIEYCGAGFWVFQFLYIPFGILFLGLVLKILSIENKKKIEAGYIFHKSDLKWSTKTCLQISLNGILVGIVSSLLGIGGAIISSPMLLKLGVETQEASFTASFMALFSSIVSVIVYLIIGKIRWDYAGFCGGLGLIAMVFGLEVILKFLKKRNMMYVIVFTLVFMIFVSFGLNLYSNIDQLINKESSRVFHPYC